MHTSEHIPYKAAASVYSSPPREALAPASGGVSERAAVCVVFSPCEPVLREVIRASLCQFG